MLKNLYLFIMLSLLSYYCIGQTQNPPAKDWQFDFDQKDASNIPGKD